MASGNQYSVRSAVSFTNRAESATANRVYIAEGATIRLVYNEHSGNYSNSNVKFFDYDISDGKIYNGSGKAYNTSQQNDNTWYAKTKLQGINKYTGQSGTVKLGYGNVNTGSGLGDETWNGNTINKYNIKSYKGCTFGLVTGFNADGTKKPLADAKFSIYEVNPEVDPSATAMWLKPLGPDASGVDVYEHVHNPADTTGLTQMVTTNGTTGKFRIIGMDSGIYWMKEVAAPAGYHMLRTLVEVKIGTVGSYSDPSLDYTVADTIDGYIEVLNSTGVVLPETGGIGTMLFVGIGSFLVLSMGVLLVVKKRMSQVIFTK